MADTCGAAGTANEILDEVLQGKVFDLPPVDLNSPDFQLPPLAALPLGKPLKNEDLTEIKLDGKGTFDVLMSAAREHINAEYNKGRITQHEFSTAYVGITNAVLAQSVQFLLNRDTTYWQAVMAERQARMAEVAMMQARVDFETAKANLRMVQYRAMLAETEYANGKIQLAISDKQLCLLEAQLAGVELENQIKEYTLTEMMPLQMASLEKDNDIKDFNLTQILPTQKLLMTEQMEAQRAQTMDKRSDGSTNVTGMIGKQKDLYTQQIKSYQDDSKTKVAKIFTDAWITMRTMDEGYPAPNAFTNANIHNIIDDLAISVDLTTGLANVGGP